ncbi:hypothetical protein [Thiohalorhabdus methylotrophus]|uniref:Uncharacterized protein n=1 Tax=Thiohalorhabdus methylotrophus TaxID=3242694 RepID=A0ABV4TT31_9GAMM
MSTGHPFVPGLVALLPASAAGGVTEWAHAMFDAGVDGLAVRGDARDPATRHLLAALRDAVLLPLELHIPEALVAADAAWTEGLAESGLDWVVPGRPLPEPTVQRLEALGTGVAWPLAGAPESAIRVHAWMPSPGRPPDFSRAPGGAERSVTVERPWEGDVPPAVGADTLVIPGDHLAPPDPGATVARWRGAPG